MPTCPSGHASASEDFCDVCGVLIGAAPSLAAEPAQAETAWSAGGAQQAGATAGHAAPPGEACPRCGVTRAGQFCESCGYDFALAAQDTFNPAAAPQAPPPPPAPDWGAPSAQSPQSVPFSPSTPDRPSAPQPPAPVTAAQWSAVVSADRDYYDSVQALGGPDAAGIAFPGYCPQRRFRLVGSEVRIGRHSASSGIEPEIDLSVPPADPGVSRLHAVLLRSPDGSWSVVDPGSANGTAVNGSEIPTGQAVPLRDGDRIHLGAWTELRLVRDA